MAKYSQVVSYNIQTTLDASGIAKLQAEIRNVETELVRMANQNLISNSSMQDASNKLRQLRTQISSAFNANLGMLDTKKFTDGLKSANLSLVDLQGAFKTAGTVGEAAFVSTLGRLGKLDTGIKSVSRTTEKLFNTIGNTVRWGIVASGFQTILNSAHQTVQYVRDLDTSLTNIMMVTQQSKEQMNEFAQSANDAAKALSSTTVSMTDAALVFAQQGFDTQMSEQLAQRSTQLANISQQETAVTSDQITTIMNAYDFTGDLEQIDAAMDSWANVANVSAADVEELATAAQKAASTANTTGVTLDQLNAQIATIESVTREAPENIGNALKTIYSRFADISMGNTLEDGVNLGNIAETLGKVGVEVLNDEGRMNNVGDIMEQLMEVWSTLDQTQQNAISTVIAGRYQLSRFQALMNRSDLYQDYLGASENAEGTADQMQEIYANSMEGRLNQLQATAEGIFNDIFNTDDFYGMIDALTTVLDLTNQWVNAIGGGGTALQGLGAIATRVFSDNIAQSLNNFIQNRNVSKQQQQNRDNAANQLRQAGIRDIEAGRNQSTIDFIEKGLTNASKMSTEQQEAYNKAVDTTIALKKQQAAQENEILQTQILMDAVATSALEKEDDKSLMTSSVNEETGVLEVDSSGLDKMVPETMEKMQLMREDTAKKLASRTIAASSDLEKLRDSVATLGKEGGVSIQKLDAAMGNLEVTTGKVEALFNEDTQTGKKLNSQLNALTESFTALKNAEGTEQQEQAMKNFSETIRETLAQMQRLNAAANNGNIMDANTLYGKRNALADTDEKVAAQQQINAATAQGYDTQTDIANIVNATGAVGQLAFTWQSFQALGSIWNNSDLELGEKITQTIINLAMNIPNLVSAFAELQTFDISKTFESVANSIQGVDKENKTAAASTVALGAAQATTSKTGKLAALSSATLTIRNTALGVASAGAAAAVRGLGAAMSFLASGPGIALVLGLTAVSSIISAVSANAEQAYADAKQLAEDASSSLSEQQTQIDSFNQLYEEYKQTGDASEEFISTAQSVSEALGIQNADVLIANDHWSQLASSIDKAAESNRQYAASEIRGFLNGENATSLAGNPFGIINGSIYSDLRASVGTETATGLNGTTYDVSANQELTSALYQAEQNNSPSEAIGAVRKSIQDYQSEIDKLDKEISNAEAQNKDTSGLEGLRQSYQTKIDNLNQALSAEDIQDYINYTSQLAEIEAQDLSFEGNVDTFDVNSIWENFNRNEDISNYLESFGSWTDQLSWMIEHTNDEVAKLTLQLEQAYITSGQMLQGKITDTINVEGIETSRFGVEDNTQYAQLMTENLQNQIKNSGLSRSEQLNFIATIDEDASLAEIQQQIDNINASDNLPKLTFEPTLTDRSDFSDEEISDLLSNTGMSESGFNRMVSSTFNSEGFQNEATKIEEEIKALRESGDTSEDTADKIAELRQEYEDLGDSAEDVSAYNLQMNKGVEDLVESWEDLSAILEDDVTKGTSDYYEALGQLDEIISDILNIDTGALSDAFYTDPTNLENIQRLAEGDVAALDDLREAAAQDLIVNLQVDNISDEDKSYLINNELLPMLSELQMQLDTMPLNTTVDADTSPFISKLNELLALGQITAEQATNILSSIGMEAHIVEEQSEPVWNETKIRWPRFQQDPDTGVIQPTGDYDEISMWTEAQSSFPVIQGATYTGAGVSTIGAGSSGNAARSRGGSGGSGGGGGSGKTYEPKTKDPIEDELDRYERVNTMLEDAENRYERLNADRERLTGFDMADAMEEEVDLLNRQIALHQEKLEIQKEEAQELRDELSSQYGITFDAEGFILNYATTHERLVNEVNSLINQYNATTTEEGQKALEEQIEAAQEALDNFNETYQRYDELWAGDMQDTLNTLEDLEDQIEDIRIEMMNTAVEAVDNLQDLQESLNEFNNTFDHFGEETGLRDAELAVSNLATYFDIANESASALYDTLIQRANDRLNSGILSDDERQRIRQDIAMWENARKQIGAGSMEAGGTGLFDMTFNNLRIMQEQVRQYESTGTSTIFGENSADLYDAANEAYDQATSLLSDFEDEYENLHDAILDMIDEVAEKIEDRREQYENITDELDHQREIIELIHGDEAYDQINMVLDAQNKNYVASINEMQQTLDYWKDLLENLEEGSEEWKAVNEQIVETQSSLNDLVEESLDNLQKKYENTVNSILDTWTSNTFGGTDLDWVAEEWELINRNADYYLDDVNAAYETQKLQAKYLEMLDQTDDLYIQQMITEQMKQQLDYLHEKDKLSEYDVAYANAQLEILQKRIALEEAQRNKSQMQLRRDSQGNYSYVYTADEGDVAAAEGDLLDAQNNAYNLSKEQMKQTQDDSLSALQDAQQLLSDIWTNANLTLDEKTARTQTVIDSLKEYLTATSEQLSESEKNIINDFIGMAEMMTDENGDRISEVLEEVKNGNLEAFDLIDDRWSTALSNWLYNLDEFNMSTDDSFSQLIENSVEFQENVDSIASEVNQDFSDMGNTIAGVTDQTKELAGATSDFINQLESDSGIILKYEDQLESMREKIADTTNEMRAYQQHVNQLQADLTAKEQENANLSAELETVKAERDALKNSGGSSGSGGGGGSFGGSGYSRDDLAWGIATAIWSYTNNGWGNDPVRSGKLTGAYGVDFARQVQDIINRYSMTGQITDLGSGHMQFTSYSLLGYDTGGYTGAWSDGDSNAKNGKLAYLHQKELVLNASDTENILKAVDLVRQMVQSLKSSAVTDVFGNIANSISAQPSGETVEQNVHITAEFPNANNASEIETALLSLNERAIQYSFKKK